MRPLPYVPDFPVLKLAPAEPGGTPREHYLELWNLAPPRNGSQFLDYVELAVGEAGERPEIIIASRPDRSPDVGPAVPAGAFRHLVPVASLALLTVSATELQGAWIQGHDEATIRRALMVSLSQDRPPWKPIPVQVENAPVEFRCLSWPTGWLATGSCLGVTVAIVGHRITIFALRLVRTPQDELEQMTAR